MFYMCRIKKAGTPLVFHPKIRKHIHTIYHLNNYVPSYFHKRGGKLQMRHFRKRNDGIVTGETGYKNIFKRQN